LVPRRGERRFLVVGEKLMTARRLFLSSLVGIALMSGCGVVSDITDAQRRSEAIALELEKDMGVKPFVGWNIHNGTLTNVTVSFPVEGVAKLSVGDLNARVRKAVAQSFEKPPEHLVVSTFSKQ
jgi:hypothetical protein